MEQPPAPKTHGQFTERFPSLAKAWVETANAGRDGPLDEKAQRLVKLAVAIGALREGAVHASVRKARAMAIEVDAIEQVVALSAGTLGMPSTVAAYTWVRDVLDGE
jgi:alkylhydroperoxidase/carboxymuconolactone decarboxylase family protein YurZ